MTSTTRAFVPNRQDGKKLARIAAAFVSTGSLAEAETAAEIAVAAAPTEAEPWLVLGACRARLKEYHRAAPCYLKALDLRPDDVGAWCDLGELYTFLLDYERAAAALRQAMVLDPNADHPSGRRARAIVGRTLALLKKK